MSRRTLSGRYYLPSGVCAECIKSRRRSRPNQSVQPSGNLVLNSNVRKRLSKQADSGFPKTFCDYLREIAIYSTGMLGLSGLTFLPLYSDRLPKLWGFGLGGSFGSALFVALSIGAIGLGFMLFKGKSNRIEQRFMELVRERADKYEPRERFYGSPEWRSLRESVIKEEGRICNDCGRRIRRVIDITVDHIRPRSRYPRLALQRNNLQVLCRSCNSSKGDR